MGEIEIENFGIYEFNQGSSKHEWEHEAELEYGLTDYFQPVLGVEFKRENDESTRLEEIELGGKFQFTPQGQYWVDSGAYVRYFIPTDSDEADKVSVDFLLAKPFVEYGTTLVNIAFDQEVGKNSNNDLEAAISGSHYKHINTNTEFGVEYYADFGKLNDHNGYSEQKHQIGPVVGYKLGDYHAEFKLGYLQGISKAAPDSTIKYEIEFEF
ncbi:MAG: hypothetical protein OEY94_02080 [Alphaproteobacteria bacterium]|nr:hypothetical protein [Alphaproteobacteria bacterium]